MVLSPSLLSCNFYQIRPQLQRLYDLGIRHLHLDVMDGAYVPNISFGAPVIRAVKEGCKEDGLDFFFDVHLMVEEPQRFIEDYVKAGANSITVHQETCKHLDSCLNQIKKAGVKAGVSLNPATSLTSLEEILPIADMVLLMSVNPGFGGQNYIPYVSDKIRRLCNMRAKRGLDFSIQVDGGVNSTTLHEVLQAGADNIVAGSAIFEGQLEENVLYFKKAMGL